MDPATIGTAITAGASFLGKLFGGGGETTTSQVNYKDMVKDAEAAGFNPLTVLRNGGAAGYTQTHHPALSSGAFIADAMAGLGNVVASIDPMRDATAKLEHEIKQATLESIQADSTYRRKATMAIGGAPVSTGARNVAVQSALARGNGPVPVTTPIGPNLPAEADRDKIVNPFPTWSGIEIPGWLKSGEAWENVFGDLGTVPASIVGIPAIIGHNAYRLGKKIGHGSTGPKTLAPMRRYQDATRKTLRQTRGDPFAAWGY
nr:MAG: hypothetical protein [Microvirus sp.]